MWWANTSSATKDLDDKQTVQKSINRAVNLPTTLPSSPFCTVELTPLMMLLMAVEEAATTHDE